MSEPTTIGGWLDTLPPEIKDKAFANQRDFPMKGHSLYDSCKSLDEAVRRAFLWHLTPERSDYWDAVSSRLDPDSPDSENPLPLKPAMTNPPLEEMIAFLRVKADGHFIRAAEFERRADHHAQMAQRPAEPATSIIGQCRGMMADHPRDAAEFRRLAELERKEAAMFREAVRRLEGDPLEMLREAAERALPDAAKLKMALSLKMADHPHWSGGGEPAANDFCSLSLERDRFIRIACAIRVIMENTNPTRAGAACPE